MAATFTQVAVAEALVRLVVQDLLVAEATAVLVFNHPLLGQQFTMLAAVVVEHIQLQQELVDLVAVALDNMELGHLQVFLELQTLVAAAAVEMTREV
jgi:FKBP-type peptidyl-prolyl cis-trans isomerase 2